MVWKFRASGCRWGKSTRGANARDTHTIDITGLVPVLPVLRRNLGEQNLNPDLPFRRIEARAEPIDGLPVFHEKLKAGLQFFELSVGHNLSKEMATHDVSGLYFRILLGRRAVTNHRPFRVQFQQSEWKLCLRGIFHF